MNRIIQAVKTMLDRAIPKGDFTQYTQQTVLSASWENEQTFQWDIKRSVTILSRR